MPDRTQIFLDFIYPELRTFAGTFLTLVGSALTLSVKFRDSLSGEDRNRVTGTLVLDRRAIPSRCDRISRTLFQIDGWRRYEDG